MDDPLLCLLSKLVLLLLCDARPGVGVEGEDLAAVRVNNALGDAAAGG